MKMYIVDTENKENVSHRYRERRNGCQRGGESGGAKEVKGIKRYKPPPGTSLAVQWLGLCASTAGGPGIDPCWGTKILHAAWHGKKQKQKDKQTEKILHLYNK